MNKDLLIPLVDKIHGCTFANLDALTEPKRGVMCRIIGERVIIFRPVFHKSGWEGMIKRRLAEAGKDPDSFHVGPLPWGTRMGDLPIIEHNGKYFLQTIQLAEGKTKYFLAGNEDMEVDPRAFGIRPNRGFEGLPPEDTVKMHTYNIDNLTKITLMGQTITEADFQKRTILSLKFEE